MDRKNQPESTTDPVPGLSVTFELREGSTLAITVPGTLTLQVAGCRAQPCLVYTPELGKPRWGDLASVLAEATK